MTLEVNSFYKTSVSRRAFDNQHVQQRIFTPNPQVSDDDDCDDGNNVLPMHASANVCDASLVPSSECEYEVDTEIERGRSTPHKTPVLEAKTNGNEYIWRKVNAADVDALYTDAAYPNPSDGIASPVDYFIPFCENPDGSNCRANKSILNAMFWQMHSHFQFNEQESKQLHGILLMMGIIKYSQYSMYWSPESYTPIIADAISPRFENRKRFLHYMILPKWLLKMVTLFTLWRIVLSTCRSIPQEESHSVDEQSIPIKCRSCFWQYLP